MTAAGTRSGYTGPSGIRHHRTGVPDPAAREFVRRTPGALIVLATARPCRPDRRDPAARIVLTGPTGLMCGRTDPPIDQVVPIFRKRAQIVRTAQRPSRSGQWLGPSGLPGVHSNGPQRAQARTPGRTDLSKGPRQGRSNGPQRVQTRTPGRTDRSKGPPQGRSNDPQHARARARDRTGRSKDLRQGRSNGPQRVQAKTPGRTGRGDLCQFRFQYETRISLQPAGDLRFGAPTPIQTLLSKRGFLGINPLASLSGVGRGPVRDAYEVTHVKAMPGSHERIKLLECRINSVGDRLFPNYPFNFT